MSPLFHLRGTVPRLVSRAAPGLVSRHPRGARLAPSPPSSAIFGHLGLVHKDRVDFLMRAALEHGNVVRFELPLITAHLFAHPDHVQRVLVDDHRIFTKQTRGYANLRAFLGNGLVTSEGDFWLRQRRIAQPAFHRKRIAGFADSMVRAAESMCERWAVHAKDGRPIDIATEMGRLTLQVAGETLLSTDPSDDASVIASSLVTVLQETNDRLSAVVSVPLDWPLPRNRRYLAARAQLDRIVLEIIEERRRGQTSHDDLLQMFLEARDDVTGERMDDRQLRDEVMTMFVAGHETTSNALSWTLYLLSRFPAIGRALHDEATRVLGDRSATFDDLPKLELTRRVLQEAMRLYPPVWILSRSPSEDVEIDGYDVPARSLVFVSPWVTHRHPAFWEDPEGFDPDRFLPERMKRMHRHQYFPFSAGPRMCIGSTFAMMEGQLVLATIARRYRVDVLSGRAIVAEPLITLRPRDGIRASVHRIG